MTTLVVRAIRFDGKTAVARGVDVRIEGRDLTVVDDEVVLDRTRIDPSRVSERLQRAPRIIALEQGATLEVPDPDGSFDRALEAAGVEPSAVERMQRFWPAALCSLAGVAILAELSGGTRRFNELLRSIDGISRRMLAATLRRLEQDGLIVRRVYADVPARVEYDLTRSGAALFTALTPLSGWALQHLPAAA